MKHLFKLTAGLVIGIGIAPADATGSNLVSSQKLSWPIAERLASEAVRVCAERGYSVTATVVDTSGHQQAVIKGDTVPLQSLSVSYPQGLHCLLLRTGI